MWIGGLCQCRQQHRDDEVIDHAGSSIKAALIPTPDQVLLPSMETIDEAEEESKTTSSEADQLMQQIQQELEEETRRHDNALVCSNQRVKEEKERHSKQHRLLEAKLLQAIAQAEGSATVIIG